MSRTHLGILTAIRDTPLITAPELEISASINIDEVLGELERKRMIRRRRDGYVLAGGTDMLIASAEWKRFALRLTLGLATVAGATACLFSLAA
jgi:hypothetical protein